VVHRVGSRRERRQQVSQLLEVVGFDASFAGRYPHEFSGGQRQRIGIARALALKPKLIVCDEPVSALDVSIQAQILNLLKDIQDEFGLSYLFIAHNLAVVRHVSDQVAVMYLGQIMEIGDADLIYAQPRHPYTIALLDAVPVADPKIARGRSQIIVPGDLPSPADPPAGCVFHTRCAYAQAERCPTERPILREVDGRKVACHFAEQIRDGVIMPKGKLIAQID
jgi:peptide/nickel transport system ATP-binding protein